MAPLSDFNPYSRIVSRTVYRVLRLIHDAPGTTKTQLNWRNDAHGRRTIDTLVRDGYIDAVPMEDRRGHRLTLSPKGAELLSLMESITVLTLDDCRRFDGLDIVGGGRHD